ncbi:MAG: hypothetical protein ACYC67_14720 [Prosthecobacter sp.]|jgi:chromosome segregation ATPase
MYFVTPDQILSRLEAGFETSSARLKALESKLSTNVQRGREFGAKHLDAREFNTQWNSIEESLRRIQSLAAETDLSPQGKHTQKDIEHALQMWNELQAEITRLETALTTLRDKAAKLDKQARQQWNTLAQSFEEDLQALLVCARTLRIRLELLDGRSQQEVDIFIRHVLAELRDRPRPSGVDASTYELDYLKSAIETSHEKNECLGFPTIIKTLFTWFENPEERVSRTLLVPVD